MEAMHHIFDTNLYGVQRMIRAALPSMRANGSGYIFNISSQLGRVVIPESRRMALTSPSFSRGAIQRKFGLTKMPRPRR